MVINGKLTASGLSSEEIDNLKTSVEKTEVTLQKVQYTAGAASTTSVAAAEAARLATVALAISASAATRNRLGVLAPLAVAISSAYADGQAYPGRFVIAISHDAVTYVPAYTSGADESAKSYTLPATMEVSGETEFVVAVRVRVYKAGGTEQLLDERSLAIASDYSTAPVYLGPLTSPPATGMVENDFYFDANIKTGGGGVIRYYTGSAWAQATTAWAGYYDAWARASTDAFSWTTTSHEELEQAIKLETAVARAISDKQVVSALPANPYTGYVAGDIVVLTTDHKLYRLADPAGAGTTGWTNAVATVDLSGTIAGTQIADAAVSMAKFASGIRPPRVVSALPANPYTGYVAGDLVSLTTDGKLYRMVNMSAAGTGGWSAAVPAADVSGQLASTQIAAIEAAKVTGQLSASQLAAIEASKITGQLSASQISALEAAKITGLVSSSQIDSLAAAKISGQLSNEQIATLAASKISGQLSDSQIAAIAAAKLTGQITTTQITDNAITTGKILASAVKAAQIDTGAVTTDKMTANSISGDRIAAGTLDASKIVADSITAAQIHAGAIGVDEIAAGVITAGKLAVGTGKNLLYNSDFSAAAWSDNWQYCQWSGSGTYGVNMRPDWGLPAEMGSQTAYVSSPDAAACDIGFYANKRIPVIEGKRYEVSGYFGTHRDTGYLTIEWSSNSAGIGSSRIEIPFGLSGGATLAGYSRVGGFVVAPAGVTFGRLCIHMVNGGTNPYLFMTRLYFGEATANQTELSPWAASAVTSIGPGYIETGAITTEKMTANSINGDRIAANTLSADKIVANSLTAGQIAAGAIGADEIAANAVTAAKILAGTITAAQINTANLGADTALINSIVASSAFIAKLATQKQFSSKMCATDPTTPRMSIDWDNAILAAFSDDKAQQIKLFDSILRSVEGAYALDHQGQSLVFRIASELTEVARIKYDPDSKLIQAGLPGTIPTSGLAVPVKFAGSWAMGSWGSYSAFVNVAASFQDAIKLSNGKTLMVYADSGNSYHLTQIIRNADGSIYSGPTAIGTATGANYINLAILNDGKVFCAYRDYATNYIYYILRTTDGQWTNPTVGFATAVRSFGITKLANGTILLMCEYGTYELFEVIYTDGSGFGTGKKIEAYTDATSYSDPTLLTYDDGSVLMIYSYAGNEPDSLRQKIRSSSGSWGATSVIEAVRGVLSSLCLLPDGTTLLVYKNANTGYLAGKVLATGGAWGSSSNIEASASVPSVLLNDNQDLLLFYLDATTKYIRLKIAPATTGIIPKKTAFAPAGMGIVELGQNSNGYYFKIKTGTGTGILICFAIGKSYVLPSAANCWFDWDFPAQFYVSGTVRPIAFSFGYRSDMNQNTSQTCVPCTQRHTSTKAYFINQLGGAAGAQLTYYYDLFAIGFYAE